MSCFRHYSCDSGLRSILISLLPIVSENTTSCHWLSSPRQPHHTQLRHSPFYTSPQITPSTSLHGLWIVPGNPSSMYARRSTSSHLHPSQTDRGVSRTFLSPQPRNCWLYRMGCWSLGTSSRQHINSSKRIVGRAAFLRGRWSPRRSRLVRAP